MMDHIDDQIDDDVVNEMLSKELLKMSVDDRNAMQEEIHGVYSSAIPETPELLSRSLDEFQREIDGIEKDAPSSSVTKKKVYNIILSRREKGGSKDHYAIDDNDFRLRFLRVELFDVPKAVTRFLNYLNYSYESWGEVILERPVCMKDLLRNKDEARELRKGHIQVLPSRDRSGRKVTFTAGQSLTSDQFQQEQMYKVCFYVHDASTRDCIEDQRMGVVSYFQMRGITTQRVPLGTFQTLKNLLNSIPVRHAAYHISMPDKPFFRWLKNMMAINSTDSLRNSLRVVTVVGSEQECRYQQNTYGIPTQLYPSTTTGTIKRTYFKQWMKVRQLKEEKYFKKNRDEYDVDLVDSMVECPFLKDVVFRKGTPSLDHFGNVVFRDLMLNYLEGRRRRELRGSRMDRDSTTAAMDSLVSPDHVGSSQTTAESKIVTIYGDTEDQIFCDQLIEEIEIKRKGRFLEWNQSLSTWIRMKSNRQKNLCKIRQKVLVAIYHCRRKASKLQMSRDENTTSRRNSRSKNSAAKRDKNDTVGKEDSSDNNYQFIEGGRNALEWEDSSCIDCSGRSDASKKRKPNSPGRRSR